MQRPALLTILKYSEPFHNCILTFIQNPVTFTKIDKACVTLEIQNSSILTILEYSEPSQRFKMECFAKIVKSYNHISKAVCLRFLTGSWICPSLNKYSLTCTMYCMRHKIQTCSGIFRSYSDIFSHIVVYLAPCVTLAY